MSEVFCRKVQSPADFADAGVPWSPGKLLIECISALICEICGKPLALVGVRVGRGRRHQQACLPFQFANIQPSLLPLVKKLPRQLFVFFQKSFIQPFLFCVPNNLYNFFICKLPTHRWGHARHRHSCFLHSMNAIGKVIGIRILTTDFKCPGGIVPDNLPIF